MTSPSSDPTPNVSSSASAPATTATTATVTPSKHTNDKHNNYGQSRTTHLSEELASGRMTPPPPFRYQPRSSRLDREHLNDTREQFRGFVTLFWTAMAAYVVLTAMRNFREQGIILGGDLFDVFSADALILVMSDATMVATTGLVAVPWSWLESRGWIPRNVHIALQAIWETIFITMAVVWAHWRNWPWIQTTFFVLHSIVMLMKMHSYLARNHEMVSMRYRVTVLKQWLTRQRREQQQSKLNQANDNGEVVPTDENDIALSSSSSSTTPTKEQNIELLSAVTDIVEDAHTNAATLSAMESDMDNEDSSLINSTIPNTSNNNNTSMSTAIMNQQHDNASSSSSSTSASTSQILRERRPRRSSLTGSPTRPRIHSHLDETTSHLNATTLSSSYGKQSTNGVGKGAGISDKNGNKKGSPFVEPPASAPASMTSASTSKSSASKSASKKSFTRPMPSALLMDIMIAEKRHASTSHVASDTLLYGHSDAHISRRDAQRELEELEADLCPAQCAYPNNITFTNYLSYLIVPTLVYEIAYPRTTRIRPAYVFEKLAAILGTFTLMYMMVEHYVLPALYQTAHLPIWYALPQMLFPVLVVFLLTFFIIFEFICNAFAELARFADRSFYDDWWNSTTFEEFARNWNKPVHHFLLRHVYVPLYRDCGLSRQRASFITFLVSSIFHEFAIAVVCGNLRMYLFMFQMTQIPLIWLGKLVGPKTREMAGNWFFWFSMTVGPPLLLCLYCREIIQPNGSVLTMILGGDPMA